MITTKNFSFTPEMHFKILFQLKRRRYSWIFSIIFLSAFFIFLVKSNYSRFDYFFFFTAIAFPLFILLQYLYFVHSSNREFASSKRYLEINKDRMITRLDDGRFFETPVEDFLFIKKLKDFYLVYVTNRHFLPIPKSTFKSKKDHDWFKKEILSQIKQKK